LNIRSKYILVIYYYYRRPMWQAVKELTLSASTATAVGEQTLTLANRRYSTVCGTYTGGLSSSTFEYGIDLFDAYTILETGTYKPSSVERVRIRKKIKFNTAFITL